MNRYYRNVAGVTKISAEGRAYRAAVVNLLAEHRTAPPLAGAVAVDIEAHMPDRRRRDLDNLLKGLLDALTHAGLWLDDSQVADLASGARRRSGHGEGAGDAVLTPKQQRFVEEYLSGLERQAGRDPMRVQAQPS